MSPEQQQINDLNAQVKTLMNFMRTFENAGQVAPQHAQTLRTIVGATSLADLDDVVLTAPTVGQVLKYNGTVWYNGTDEVV